MGLEKNDVVAVEWWTYMVNYLCMTAGHHTRAQFIARNPDAPVFIVENVPGT